ncbi:chymotrypsin B [Octopus bimaculoides]|uniref:chymotrypsin B n=1 Tax=Octopus bimaculoides TaxID=37653 RepID=UPI00071D3CD4|nr:chymotrypsin B [Octopus bimaculoides]|eukprot:XP_014785320.1 PREDICTED: chymotrypsin B-like [Octopus bimaculoides]
MSKRATATNQPMFISGGIFSILTLNTLRPRRPRCDLVAILSSLLKGLSGEHVILAYKVFVSHPEFVSDSSGFPFDIALVKLSQKAQITSAVAPMALPENATETFVNRECWVLGWGLTDSAASVIPNVLQEANITAIANEECAERWSFIEILESHLCVYKPTRSPCNGDSGGSLACRDGNDTWRLAGVISWGISTCSGDYPAVNTRVSSYLDWIGEVISEN